MHGCRLVPRRVYPSQTGFVRRLYSINGVPEEFAHRIEETFYSPVDSLAAQTLKLLLAGSKKSDLTNSQVSSWSRFLLSLSLRMPEDVAILKERWRETMLDISPEVEEKYLLERRQDEPITFRDAVLARPDHVFEQEALDLLINLNDSTNTGNVLNSMHWRIINVKNSKYELYLSDRPLFVIHPLRDVDGTICLPVGPFQLFVASKSEDVISQFLSLPAQVNVRDTNRIVVSQAVKFSYATNDIPLRFMKNNFATSFDVRAIQRT